MGVPGCQSQVSGSSLYASHRLTIAISAAGYLKDPRDVHTLRRGIRLLLRVAQTPPISDALDGDCSRADLDHRLHELSDEELDEVIRQRCETVYHPACTCRMASDGALENRMRVHGVRRLRVCDASAFPTIASGHTVSRALLVLYRPYARSKC